MAKSDVSEFEGSLFPVFVTADLPLETVNEVLQRCADYTKAEEFDELEGLVLVQDTEAFDPKVPTPLPVAAAGFRSPFTGKSLAEVRAVFEDKVAPSEDEEVTSKADSTFIVLDERTARDRTVLIVSLEGNETITARADPEVAAIYSMSSEMGNERLGESADDAKDAEGIIVLTKERYQQKMEEEMQDEDDEDINYDEDDD